MSSGSDRPTGVTWAPLEFLGQLVDVRRVPRERETGAHMQMSTLCFFLILEKMFIRLHGDLAAAWESCVATLESCAASCGIFCCSAWTLTLQLSLPRSMWDLSSSTMDRTRTPYIARWILNHGTTREVPVICNLMLILGKEIMNAGTPWH